MATVKTDANMVKAADHEDSINPSGSMSFWKLKSMELAG